MPNTIMKNSETTYAEILHQAGQRIQRIRHFDCTPNRRALSDPDNDIVVSVQNLCEKFRNQQRIIRQQSEFLDIYRDKLVSFQQNLDNCTENARTTNPMPLTEGAEDMNRRQKLRINGQEKWISFSSTQELIDLVQAEFSKQKQGEESPATVSDYMLNWFETYKRPKLDPNTAKGDISKINKHILPVMGNKRINDVTVADVQKIMSNLQSASTAKQVKSIINQCFEAAIADELYTHPNPVADKRIVMPTKVTKRSSLEKDDLAILLETLPKMKPDHACLLAILIMTGCRRGEALGVRWEDINWEKKTIHLQRVIRFRNNQPEASDKMKTKSANRTVSLWNDLVPFLGGPQKSGFIIHRNDAPITERQYTILWKGIQKELKEHGLKEGFTAHQLRHTYATMAANSGDVTPKVLQGMMGHANFQTTMNTYAGLDTEQMLESSRDLGAKYAEITSKSCSNSCSA